MIYQVHLNLLGIAFSITDDTEIGIKTQEIKTLLPG